jgi:hypothetical protein
MHKRKWCHDIKQTQEVLQREHFLMSNERIAAVADGNTAVYEKKCYVTKLSLFLRNTPRRSMKVKSQDK